MTRAIRLGSIALLTVLASCGGGDVPAPPPPPPIQAGDLVVTYLKGGATIGAMLLTISGGAVSNVSVRGGLALQASFAAPLAGTTRVVVTGTMSSGDILTVHVPDISLAGNYSIRVDQVADDATFSLIDASLHTLTIHR